MTEYPPPRENEPNVPLGKNPGQPQPTGGQYPPPGGQQYPPPGGQQYQPPAGQGYPPPPQAGQYPPQGGFPPPPPAGGFAQGGYPSAGGFGTPQLSVGSAISYGWAKYKANAGAWIAICLLAVVVSWFVQFAFSGFRFETDYSSGGAAALSLVGTLVSFIVSTLFRAAFTNGALAELDGNRPAIGTFFNFKNLSAVFIVAILVGIATAVGFVLLIIPGIIVLYLTWYALTFAIDREQDAITAIKSSFELTSKNVGSLLLLALACFGLNVVGVILCFVGLLVTIPVTLIASTYAYRVLTGGQVSPAA
jgi:hypothetical protein